MSRLSMLGLILLVSVIVISGCNMAVSEPTPVPTKEPAPIVETPTQEVATDEPADAATNGGGQAVVGWYGLVTALPEGSQFDDYLFLLSEGAGAYGIAGNDAAIEEQIVSLRENNARAHFWGTITCNVPDYNGCQIRVNQLRPDGPGEPSEPVTIEGWQGSIFSAPELAQVDDYFVLAGDYPIRYGIDSALDVSGERIVADELEALRDTRASVTVWGSVSCGMPDANNCRITVDRLEADIQPVIQPTEVQPAAVVPMYEETIADWHGTIVSNAPDSEWRQFDDYFQLMDQNGSRFGIASNDAVMAQDLVSLRDSGQEVRLWGTLRRPVTDAYGAQILVSQLVVVQPPTPRPTPVSVCSLAPRLNIGATGMVSLGPLPNAMRSEPGTTADSAILGTIPSGTLFTVLEGPQCAGNYNWWKVNANGFIGWTAEGQSGEYWVQPVSCANGTQVRLVPGTQARVTLDPPLPNTVRSLPNRSGSSTALGEIPTGGVFTVLEGPQCSSAGLPWWKVNYNGLVGWTAEGDSGVYWLEPYNPNQSEQVTDLRGVIVGIPNTQPGSGPDDYFQTLDQAGTRYGIGTTDPVIYEQIETLRDSGLEVRVWGDLRRGVPDYNSMQINVTQILYVNPTTVPPTCSLPPNLAGGTSARVTPGLPNTVRSAPGTSNGRELGNLPGETIFSVMDGPRCVDGLNWWLVRGNGMTGWTAEGQSGTYWLEPMICGNGMRSRLVPGNQARVSPVPPLPNTVRSGPGGSASTSLGEIPAGGVFTVLEGPRCGPQGRMWWKVNYNGLVGWTAEGEAGTYWLEPLS